MNWDQFNQTQASLENILNLIAIVNGWIMAYPQDEQSSQLYAEMNRGQRILQQAHALIGEAKKQREHEGDPHVPMFMDRDRQMPPEPMENNCDHDVQNEMCVKCGYRWPTK